MKIREDDLIEVECNCFSNEIELSSLTTREFKEGNIINDSNYSSLEEYVFTFVKEEDKDIQNFADKYETFTGERGVSLSLSPSQIWSLILIVLSVLCYYGIYY